MPAKPRVYEGSPIDGNSSYLLGDFMRRAGVDRKGMRAARQAGLQVRKVGRRHHVLGRDWIEYLETKAEVVS